VERGEQLQIFSAFSFVFRAQREWDSHARTHAHTRIEKMAGGEEVGTGAVGVPSSGNTISTVVVVIGSFFLLLELVLRV
jgi:hypothetical protein